MQRTFKAIYLDSQDNVHKEGRFKGNSPTQASKKALTSIYRKYAKDEIEPNKIIFAIKEVTRRSKKKYYCYSGSRILFDQPVKVNVAGGRSITYKYKTSVKKCNYEDCINQLFPNENN